MRTWLQKKSKQFEDIMYAVSASSASRAQNQLSEVSVNDGRTIQHRVRQGLSI